MIESRHRPLLAEFDRTAPILSAREASLRHEVGRALERVPGVKLHSITGRVKSRASLERKLARPDRSYDGLWDVTDLVGLRVVTYFEDDVDRVGNVVEAKLPVVLEHSVDKRKRHAPSAFGYRSLHYVFRAGGELPPEACFELQVRTVLEHAWAEIEHDLGYKSPALVPEPVRRRLHRIASLLELADEEFAGVRRSLDDYARALPRRIDEEADAVPLDRMSLVSLVHDASVQELDREIASRLSCTLADDVFFPDYLLSMLAHAKLTTVGETRRALEGQRTNLSSLVVPYFEFAEQTWNLSPQGSGSLPRGYALFFLVHAVALVGTSLRIDKVQRLAMLYRELDYPDDERAAQRVASQLVDAFTAAR